MRRRALSTIAAWAGGTCAVALALLLPGSLQADDPKPAPPQPVLKLQGAELTMRLETADATAAPGVVRVSKDQMPTLLLVARNPTRDAVEVHPTIDVLSSPPIAAMSRTISIPKSIWRRETTLTLAPGGEETAKVKLDKPLVPGSFYTVRLESRAGGINALSFIVQKDGVVTASPNGTIAVLQIAPPVGALQLIGPGPQKESPAIATEAQMLAQAQKPARP